MGVLRHYSSSVGYIANGHPSSKEYERVFSGCIIITFNRSWINHADQHLDGHSGYHSQVDADKYRLELTNYREKKYAEISQPIQAKKDLTTQNAK
jgi:hypothetical protein